MYDWMFFGTVLAAGMASFMMPCILPLIPAYLTYLTGKTSESDFSDPFIQKNLTIKLCNCQGRNRKIFKVSCIP